MSANGFLGGLLRRDADESDGGSGATYSGQEIAGGGDPSGGRCPKGGTSRRGI